MDNAQLVVENAGKAVLLLFGVAPKTHEPARLVASLLRTTDLPPEIVKPLQSMLPHLLALGPAEHFLTDYGNEAMRTLPWDLFSEDSAEEAIGSARLSVQLARDVVRATALWREDQA